MRIAVLYGPCYARSAVFAAAATDSEPATVVHSREQTVKFVLCIIFWGQIFRSYIISD